MGYLTEFKLQIDGLENLDPLTISILNREVINALPEWLVSMVDMNPFHIEDYAEKRNLNYDGWKWYQHDDDMFKLSKAVPNLTFHLYGRGEDDFDIWKSTYKDGKSEQHEVVEIVYSDGTREKV